MSKEASYKDIKQLREQTKDLSAKFKKLRDNIEKYPSLKHNVEDTIEDLGLQIDNLFMDLDLEQLKTLKK